MRAGNGRNPSSYTTRIALRGEWEESYIQFWCGMVGDFADKGCIMRFDQKIAKRADGMREWLNRNYPKIKSEQAHLVEGTPERGYWHAGYRSALCDILSLMDQEMNHPLNMNNREQDNDNRSI